MRSHHRPAERKAKLILVVRRGFELPAARHKCGIAVEQISSLQCVVPVELEQGAVEDIVASPRNHVDLPAGTLPKFS